jgi:hypothetical protein
MNRQTRALSKKGLCTRNLGPNTQVTEIVHGRNAFAPPDKAIRNLKEGGSRSWKTTKRHPANVEIGKR